jgi:hypothetical protein
MAHERKVWWRRNKRIERMRAAGVSNDPGAENESEAKHGCSGLTAGHNMLSTHSENYVKI